MNEESKIFVLWGTFIFLILSGLCLLVIAFICMMTFGYERLPEILSPKDDTPSGIKQLRRAAWIVIFLNIIVFTFTSFL